MIRRAVNHEHYLLSPSSSKLLVAAISKFGKKARHDLVVSVELCEREPHEALRWYRDEEVDLIAEDIVVMVVLRTFCVPALPSEIAYRNPRLVDVYDVRVLCIEREYLPCI